MRAGLAVGVVSAAAFAVLPGCGGSPASSPTQVPPAIPPPASCPAGTAVLGVTSLTARLVASGFRNPLDLQAAPGDRERL